MKKDEANTFKEYSSSFAIVTDEELENINGSGSIWGAIAGGAVKGAIAGSWTGILSV